MSKHLKPESFVKPPVPRADLRLLARPKLDKSTPREKSVFDTRQRVSRKI